MALKVETFTSPNTHKPIGPYSHVAKVGLFITISATAGFNPSINELAGLDAYSQTRQIFELFM